MIKTAKFILPLALVAIMICGCGSGDKPKTVIVEGVLNVGGSPAEKDTSVTLVPASGEGLQPASAVSGEGGKIVFFAGTPAAKGVMPGTYKIVVTKMSGVEDGGYMDAGDSGSDAQGSAAPKLNVGIPEKYTSSKTTDLEITIDKANKKLVIDVPAS